MTEYQRTLVRYDTRDNWQSANPILALKEIGWDSTTPTAKVGDGVTHWNDLPAINVNSNAPRYNIITATAATQISGHVAVYVGSDNKAYPMTADTTAWIVAGVTIGNAAQGAQASIQIGDVLIEPSWSWAANGPVWLGPNGSLTQTLPTTGALVQIGVPIGPTGLKIAIEFYALLS